MQIIIGIIALGLSAAAKNKDNSVYGDEETGFGSNSQPAYAYFIFASVLSSIGAIVLLIMVCLPLSKGGACGGLVISIFMLLDWIIAVALLGALTPDIFDSISDACSSSSEVGDSAKCTLLRESLAAWIFGFFALLLSLVTVVLTSMGLCTPSNLKPGYPSTGGPAASQPMQRMTGQPGTAYGSTPAQNYQNNTYSASPSAQAASPSGGHGFQTGSPHQGHAGYVNGNAQAPQYPGIKASPV